MAEVILQTVTIEKNNFSLTPLIIVSYMHIEEHSEYPNGETAFYNSQTHKSHTIATELLLVLICATLCESDTQPTTAAGGCNSMQC